MPRVLIQLVNVHPIPLYLHPTIPKNIFTNPSPMASSSSSLLSLLLSLTLLSYAIASTETFVDSITDDPLIRQVVSDGGEAVDELLHADHHFSLFKAKYGRTYADQKEHDYRFSVFKANLRHAKRHQLLDPSAVHGVTQFSDLTPAEFERNYLGLHKKRLKYPADENKAPKLPTSNLPEEFDWREKGAVTAVKNQVCLLIEFFS